MHELSTSVVRAGELLEAVMHSPDPEGPTLSELAAGRPYGRTTTYRLLRSLIQLGLVRQSTTFHYTSGPMMVEYALRVGREVSWVSRARGVLERLQRATDETATLSLLLPSMERLFVDQVQCEQMVRWVATIGARAPLDRGASGIAILSRFTPEEFDHYVKLRSEDDPTYASGVEQLSVRVAEARKRGFAASRGDNSFDGAATAAPIVAGAAVIGAVSIGLPASRLTSKVSAEHGKISRSAAAEIAEIVLGRR